MIRQPLAHLTAVLADACELRPKVDPVDQNIERPFGAIGHHIGRCVGRRIKRWLRAFCHIKICGAQTWLASGWGVRHNRHILKQGVHFDNRTGLVRRVKIQWPDKPESALAHHVQHPRKVFLTLVQPGK